MSNSTLSYPFDPEGVKVSNKITAENQVIAPPELSEFLFIIPQATPFFAESLKIVHMPSQRTLVEGVDYIPTHYFHDASLQCAKPIYGSITFYDNTMTGAVRLTYQTLGGDWTLDSAKINDILSNKLINPRRVMWEQVADLPYAFPPIDHDWHLDDMVGMSEVVEVLEQIRDAMLASGQEGLAQHLADKNNPHEVTKNQVGLGSVQNYPVASVAEAQAGAVNNRYMTPLRTKQLIDAVIGTALDTHINRSDNPHNVTAAQVGLGNVQNYGLATNAQAQAGAVNTAYLTPATGKVLVDTFAVGPLNTHIGRTDNPHGVTKTQVGLGNVQNYAIADAVAARAGLANDLYMTPAMTREAITAIAMTGISDHIDNTDNPHNVTKAQVGLGSVDNYPVASQAEAEAGLASNRYLTVLRGKQLVDAIVGALLNQHLNDSSNPHGVTKAQVALGNVDNFATASLAQAEAGVASNLFMTPAGTRALIEAMGGGGGSEAALAAHLADKDNPHEVTATQLGLGNVDNYATATPAETEAGLASNLFITPVGFKSAVRNLAVIPLEDHVGNTSNPHNVTAEQLGVYTQFEMDTALDNKLDKTAQAVDSALLAGMTPEEVMAGGQPLEVYPNPQGALGTNWTKFGEMTFPIAEAGQQADLVADISGGDPVYFDTSTTFRVRLSLRNLSFSTVTLTTEGYSRDIAFGYVVTDDAGNRTVAFYGRTPPMRTPFVVSPVAQTSQFFQTTSDVISVEPANIVYLAISLPAFTRQRASFGDLQYGDLPVTQNLEQITGGLVEWVSVVDNDTDELTAQTVENSLQEDYGSFIPWSGALGNFLYNDLEIVDKWGWDNTKNCLMLDADEVESTAMLHSTNALTDYTFEVVLSSTSDKANAAGVLAAVVTVGGRHYAISAVRTPGALVDTTLGSTNFKLLTVSLNIGQVDALDLGSINGPIEWADTGAADDDRLGSSYPSTGFGWDTVGETTIRVIRTGNVLTIKTSDWNDTNEAAQVVLDFDTDPNLAIFKDRPSSVGVVSVKQPEVRFDVLSRPSQYRDYVRLNVPSDNGKQRLYRFNGAIWEMSYLGLNNPFVRPNRLYYSDFNGVLYQSQRNGRLRPMLIEAYSRDNHTFLTP